MKNYPAWVSPNEQKLLKQPKGVCSFCKQAFLYHDAWDVPHGVPRRFGGKDACKVQLLHRPTQDLKTQQDQAGKILKRT